MRIPIRAKEALRKRRAVMIEGPKFPPAPRIRTEGLDEVIVCAMAKSVV